MFSSSRIGIKIVIVILILLYPYQYIFSTLQDQQTVIIIVKDSLGSLVPGLDFRIIDDKNIVVEKAISDSSGEFETKLNMGGKYQVYFHTLEYNLKYNFKVPVEKRLKDYKLVCRIPLVLVNSQKATSNTEEVENDNGEDDYAVDIYIILQNKDQVMLINHDFILYDEDSTLIADAYTNDEGYYYSKLIEGKRYFIRSEVYDVSYSETFQVPRDVKHYTFRLILPFPTRAEDTLVQKDSVVQQVTDTVKKETVTDTSSNELQQDNNNETEDSILAKDTISFATKPETYVRTYKLENITFAFGSFDLNPGSYIALDSLIASMDRNQNLKIEIAGHTDNVGSDEDNMILSQQRANVIVEYLLKKGVMKNRLLPIGYGEKAPIAPNTTEAGRAKNRRIEVRIINE